MACEESQGESWVQSQFSCAGLDKLFVELLHSQSLKWESVREEERARLSTEYSGAAQTVPNNPFNNGSAATVPSSSSFSSPLPLALSAASVFASVCLLLSHPMMMDWP